MIVVDTNVLVYTILEVQFIAATAALFEADSHWTAPALWRSEFRNVLSSCMRTGQITLDQARRAMAAAADRMTAREFQVDSDAVLECSFQSRLSAYDCELVVLAQQLDIPLVTADRRIVRAFPKQARLLSDYAR